MTPAEGKVVLALEGGYDIGEICAGGTECLRALQRHEGQMEACGEVNAHALETVRQVVEIQKKHWEV